MEQPFGKPITSPPTPETDPSWYAQVTMRYFSLRTVSMVYLKRFYGDLQNDIDLDFFCQALVGAEIEQLKRTSGQNAVITGLSDQRIGREENNENDHAIPCEVTLSESSVDHDIPTVGP